MRDTLFFAAALLFATPVLAADVKPAIVPTVPIPTLSMSFVPASPFAAPVPAAPSHLTLPPDVVAQLNAAGPWGAYIQQYLSQLPVDPNASQSDTTDYAPITPNYGDTSDLQNQIATQDMINNQMMLNNQQDWQNTQDFINTENMVNNMQDMVNTQNMVNEQNMINSMQ
jgi:hypothetical protein